MTPGQTLYIGDSIYLTFDGWSYEIFTGERENVIVLEPDVVQTLLLVLSPEAEE